MTAAAGCSCRTAAKWTAPVVPASAVLAAAARTYRERSWAGRLQHAQQGVLQVRVVQRLAALHTDGKLAGVEALLAHAVPTPAAGGERSVQR
jgi:MYXO-CTERM domain-containing protein